MQRPFAARLSLVSYKILMILATPLLLLALLLRSKSQPAYRARIKERLGSPSFKCHHPSILIHGSSVGELTALKPFITKTIEQHPNYKVIVTSFTPTGSDYIQKTFEDRVKHTYLPFDSPILVHFFLRRLYPRIIVLMETELWPTLITQAHSKGIKLLLINARLSESSFKNYRKISSLIKPTLRSFDAILAQSNDNANRFIALGANASTTKIIGNIKLDTTLPDKTRTLSQEIKTLIGNRKVWAIGSSHEDEEKRLLQVFKQLKTQHPNLLLILAPRHKERFTALYQVIIDMGFQCKRRSQNEILDENTDIWLIDSLGELLAFYGAANICTVAGSFNQTGGHNPLEPGLFGITTTVGPNTRNTAELTQVLLAERALLQHVDKKVETIVKDIDNLLNNTELQRQQGKALKQFIEKNQGATEKAINTLHKLLL